MLGSAKVVVRIQLPKIEKEEETKCLDSPEPAQVTYGPAPDDTRILAQRSPHTDEAFGWTIFHIFVQFVNYLAIYCNWSFALKARPPQYNCPARTSNSDRLAHPATSERWAKQMTNEQVQTNSSNYFCRRRSETTYSVRPPHRRSKIRPTPPSQSPHRRPQPLVI